MSHLLGYDVGSSSIKASLLNAETGKLVISAISPKKELEIIAKQPGWAEQDPNIWWENVKIATAEIKNIAGQNVIDDIEAIGISYQMHGLVVVDDWAFSRINNEIASFIKQNCTLSLGKKGVSAYRC